MIIPLCDLETQIIKKNLVMIVKSAYFDSIYRGWGMVPSIHAYFGIIHWAMEY